MNFGTRVTVKAQAVPVYGTVARQWRPGDWDAGTWQRMEDTGVYHLAEFTSRGKWIEPAPGGGWPGDPVPDHDGVYERLRDALEPDGPGKEHAGEHRRIRRLPLDAEGVVVGWTRRQEGRYYPASGGAFGEGPDPAVLGLRRSLPVVQVALVVARGPAWVVDVWPDDLSTLGGST